MIHYDPNKDRSEEFGWKKVCDEHVPTDQEQIFWGRILILFSILAAILGLTLGDINGIF